MSRYRSIFLEPDWALTRYYGWQNEELAPGVKILSKRYGPARRQLILSELDDARELRRVFHRISDRGGPTSETILHDFANTIETDLGEARDRPLVTAGADRILNLATYAVDLDQSEEQLLAAMSPDCRRRIRKAINDGIEVIAENAPPKARLDLFLGELGRMAHDRGLHVPARGILMQMFADRRAMLFSTGSSEGGTNFVMTYRAGDKAIWLHGVGRGKSSDSGQILHWRVMQALQSTGVRWYDMGGVTGDENNGIHRFKKGFGGEFVNLGQEYVTRAPLMRLLRAGVAGVRRLSRRAA